ncbi:MAG: tripartite tricarboxylate transporter substrate binding protein [Pusillimonas sp.]
MKFNLAAQFGRSALAATLIALSTLSSAAIAQPSYPQKSVRIVLPYPAGGPTDIVARIVAQKLTESLGQSFVVENKPGATGLIGTEGVAKAAPDGYTLLVNASVQVIYPDLFPNSRLDPLQDFSAISLLAKGPLALVVNPKLPVNSVEDLITLARKEPGRLSFGSSGKGGATHLSGEAFKLAAGIDIQHVPYKGSAPALTDVAGGHVDLMFDSLASSGAFINSGKLRALAVTSATRSPAMPDVPSVAEAGVPGYDMVTWYGLWAPAGTPDDIVKLVSTETQKAFASDDVRQQLAALGLEAAANDPADFEQFTRSEQKKWSDIANRAGVQVE